MSFSDIFKSSFLNSIQEFTPVETCIALCFATVIGLYIYLVYKKSMKGVMYSSSLAFTLVGLTLVTTLVIMAVTSNVVLSLGMVGALSIVRFRAAIKDPVEIVFLFWSIACGIVIGAGMIPLAVIGSAIIGIILIVFAGRKTTNVPYILVLSLENEEAEQEALALLHKSVKSSLVKSKMVNAGGIEVTAELRTKENSCEFVNEIAALKGVNNVSLVTYNGEYMA